LYCKGIREIVRGRLRVSIGEEMRGQERERFKDVHVYG